VIRVTVPITVNRYNRRRGSVVANVPNPEKEKWIQLYKAALLESEPSLLPGRIADARASITKRLEKLRHFLHSHKGERRVIKEALDSLQLLERRSAIKAEEEQRKQRREHRRRY
jgi:hypothetical protein